MEIKHNRQRLEQFSDGVFAIAITLLALDLHVPKLVGMDLKTGIAQIWVLMPNVLTFVISFMSIAIFWVNHHQLSKEMHHVKRRVLWMNILFLLFITLIPFGTNVASANPTHPLAIATYASVLFAGSVSFSVLRYLVHRNNWNGSIPLGRSIVGPALYLCAIAAAVTYVPISYFILAIPPLFYFLPKPHSETSKEA